MAFPGRQVEKRMFPYRKPTAYITLPCATALACDKVYWQNPQICKASTTRGLCEAQCKSSNSTQLYPSQPNWQLGWAGLSWVASYRHVMGLRRRPTADDRQLAPVVDSEHIWKQSPVETQLGLHQPISAKCVAWRHCLSSAILTRNQDKLIWYCCVW